MTLDDPPVWKLVMEGVDLTTDKDDLMVNFFDVSSLLGEPTLDRSFIDEIINLALKLEHYSVFRNLKRITSDKGEDMTGLAIWALMGIQRETGKRIGILFGALADGRIHLIAVWPKGFYEELKADTLLIDRLIEKFTVEPDFWAQVDLIIGFI